MKSRSLLFMLLVALWLAGSLKAQQDPSLFFLYQVPESNLLNPAVPLVCPWYIGLPGISSLHANYGNSLTTYNQLFRKSPGGPRSIAIEQTVDGMHRRDIVATEAHVQLLALGHQIGANALYLTITEKNNLPLTLPAKGVQLLWNGNTRYEGKKTGLEGTGAFLSHYREYALTLSHQTDRDIIFGVRAKLLFGKLNLSTGKNHLNVHTDSRTFDLDFKGNFRINSSLPIIVTSTAGRLENIMLDKNVSVRELLFNRKNPGFALDAGVIYPYNDRLTLSASVLDLGFIRWRSYLNNMTGKGEFVFRGPDQVPQGSENYWMELVNAFLDSMNIQYVQKAYTTMLPPHLLAGADYLVNKKISAGLLAETWFYKTKMTTAFTLSGRYQPLQPLILIASYTLQYNGYNSLGLGVVFGRDPVQFYVLTSNVPGMIKPLATRSLNARVGLNILLGCRKKKDKKGDGFSGMAHTPKISGPGACISKVKHCHDGLPVKEKAYKKKIRKRRKKKKR